MAVPLVGGSILIRGGRRDIVAGEISLKLPLSVRLVPPRPLPLHAVIISRENTGVCYEAGLAEPSCAGAAFLPILGRCCPVQLSARLPVSPSLRVSV